MRRAGCGGVDAGEGMGVAGIFRLEIAETKAYETAEFAKENQYPLKITIEEVS